MCACDGKSFDTCYTSENNPIVAKNSHIARHIRNIGDRQPSLSPKNACLIIESGTRFGIIATECVDDLYTRVVIENKSSQKAPERMLDAINRSVTFHTYTQFRPGFLRSSNLLCK